MAETIGSGVQSVVIPPHAAGPTTLQLTLGNGEPVSNSVPFDFRSLPEQLSPELRK